MNKINILRSTLNVKEKIDVETHLSFMNMPEVTIIATSNGTRTAIVILTDLNAIEKKNPEIVR